MTVIPLHPQLQTEPDEPQLQAAAWNNLLLWVIPSPGATEAELRAYHRRFRRLRDEWGGNVGSVVVVEPCPWTPTAGERKAGVDMIADMSPYISVYAVVFEGTGLRPTFLRKVLHHIISRVRRPYPIRIFPTLEEAASWAAPLTMDAGGRPSNPGDLKLALDGLRRPPANDE